MPTVTREQRASKAEFAAVCAAGLAASTAVAAVQYGARISSYEAFIALNTMLLLWLPMCSAFLLTKLQPAELGFRQGDERLSRIYGWGMFLAVLPILFLGSLFPSSRAFYPLYKQFPHPGNVSWAYLAYFELTYGWYLFCWEWFFRGFLLFGLWRGIGSWAVVVQAVVFGLLHYQKPLPEFLASFAAGFALGIAAARIGSFFPGFLVHWASAVAYDLMIIGWNGFRLPV